ncbi:SemiSWEET transporter [Thermospira aquatica]|uniref:SemiSWEET transporter n=1 Tax=Thermospira aquatica TaxID=2828656 RepID=A0AAX3BGA8_9SPIR|nr:SemiSWEET transporter [Thermospira aquatica]
MLGFIAGFCTTLFLVPQVIKVIKTRQTRDIALGMYVLMVVGVFFWLLYGISTRALSVIVANSITFILSLIVLIYKLREKPEA